MEGANGFLNEVTEFQASLFSSGTLSLDRSIDSVLWLIEFQSKDKKNGEKKEIRDRQDLRGVRFSSEPLRQWQCCYCSFNHRDGV